MSELRRTYAPEFREGAVTIVRETGRPIVEVARDLGIGAATLGNWVKKDRLARGEAPDRTRTDPAYVRQLERELAEASSFPVSRAAHTGAMVAERANLRQSARLASAISSPVSMSIDTDPYV